jgi:flagellin
VVTLNTNIQAANALRLVNINNNNLAKTQQRLSSGVRINSASDDPSGLGIAAALTSQIRGDMVASNQNIQQAQSMLQVADAGLAQVADILQRMRELAVQANNTGLSTDQSAALDAEFQALMTAIDDIALGATFNGKVLLDGSLTGAAAIAIQIGAQQTQTTTITQLSNDYQSGGARLNVAGQDLTTAANAQGAQTQVDAAITNLNADRASLGAKAQELDFLKGALDSTIVANMDARSRITDTDVAAEVSNLVRQQLLQQAGASALSSANFAPQFVLSLLR